MLQSNPRAAYVKVPNTRKISKFRNYKKLQLQLTRKIHKIRNIYHFIRVWQQRYVCVTKTYKRQACLPVNSRFYLFYLLNRCAIGHFVTGALQVPYYYYYYYLLFLKAKLYELVA